jgi:hypothetical protein
MALHDWHPTGQIRQKGDRKMNEYRLRVGNVTLSLAFESAKDSRATARYFARPSASGEADIRLSIHFRDDASWRAEVPSSLFLTKSGDGDGFSMAGGLVEGRFSPSTGEGELQVQRLITKGGYARIYEQVFYQAFWSAVRRKGIDAFLLHSSGVIRYGQGYAFTGKSGSGKSTVARLSAGATILNDEITLIDLTGPAPMIIDTPFNGFYRGKEPGSAKLKSVMLLKQSPIHRLTRTGDLEQRKALAREIIPPMGLETAFSAARYIDMFDIEERLSAKVPLFIMEFRQDSGFWEKIDAVGGT